MSFTLVNGIRIHYHDMGKGRPLLFLHGLGGMVALQYTLTYPEDVERLIIIDSAS